MKTKVEHIICKLHWCGKKNGFRQKSQNTLEFMGAPGSSWAFMGAHRCSCVFAGLFVCLFDGFLTPVHFFDLEKNGLR